MTTSTKGAAVATQHYCLTGAGTSKNGGAQFTVHTEGNIRDAMKVLHDVARITTSHGRRVHLPEPGTASPEQHDHPRRRGSTPMNTITLEAGAARFLAEALLPAVSKDDVTPVLTGVHLSIENGKLRGLSTDRYRVHAVLVDLIGEVPEDLSALIPRAAIAWLAKTAAVYLPRRGGPLKPVVIFEFTETGPFHRVLIRVREDLNADLDEQTLTTVLIKGDFPPVMRLVEKARTAETADAAEGMLNLNLLAGLKAFGTTPPVIRFTKAESGHKEGVVHFWFGDHAEALIQPNLRLPR